MSTTTEPTGLMDDAHLEEQFVWAVSDLVAAVRGLVADVRGLVGDLQELPRSGADSSSELEG